jgi:hypothetical protein
MATSFPAAALFGVEVYPDLWPTAGGGVAALAFA